MTKKFIDFLKGILNGGVWVLTDTSEINKKYFKREFSDTYEEEIKKQQTPRKFIKEGEQIVVVSVSREAGSGVEIYDVKDIQFTDTADGILIGKERRSSRKIVSSAEVEIDDDFKAQMIASGYITENEYDKYIELDSHKELQLVTYMVM